MPRRSEVDAWFDAYDNPMKPVVLAIRDILLAVDPRVDECIKWKAPTFTFEGNLASFYPKSKKHASLMFHQGAKIPGKHPRLEGTGDTSRVMKIESLDELAKARKALEAVVRAWIALKSPGVTKPKAPANKAKATTTKAKAPAKKAMAPATKARAAAK